MLPFPVPKHTGYCVSETDSLWTKEVKPGCPCAPYECIAAPGTTPAGSPVHRPGAPAGGAKVFLLGHVLVDFFPPLGHGLTKINDNLEESVHERDSVSKNAAAVPEHRLWGPVEGVGIQDGLNHDEGLGEILPGKVVPIILRLLRAVVEDLKEWRPSKMEHELRV